MPLPLDALGLFCCELCREVAKNVRYIRAVYGDGRILDPDVKYAVKIRIAHLHAGGYEAKARQLSEALRDQVRMRDGGICVRCGAPGEEIDHINGDSPTLGNLQLLCTSCHRAKTDDRLARASDEQRAAVEELFARRIRPRVPLLLADDEASWNGVEKDLRVARRHRLEAVVAELGVDPRHPRRSWSEVADDYYDAMAPTACKVTEDDDSTYGADSYFARAMERDD